MSTSALWYNPLSFYCWFKFVVIVREISSIVWKIIILIDFYISISNKKKKFDIKLPFWTRICWAQDFRTPYIQALLYFLCVRQLARSAAPLVMLAELFQKKTKKLYLDKFINVIERYIHTVLDSFFFQFSFFKI